MSFPRITPRLAAFSSLALPAALCSLAFPVPPWQAALLGSLALALWALRPRRVLLLGLAADDVALAVATGLVAALESQRSLTHGILLLIAAAMTGLRGVGGAGQGSPDPSARLLGWAGLLAAAFWLAAPLAIQRVAIAGSPPAPRGTQLLAGLVFVAACGSSLLALGSERRRWVGAGGRAALGLLMIWAALGFIEVSRRVQGPGPAPRLLSSLGWEPFLAQRHAADAREALERAHFEAAAELFFRAARLGGGPVAFLEMAYAHEAGGNPARADWETDVALARGLQLEEAFAISYPGPLATLGRRLAASGRGVEAARAVEADARRRAARAAMSRGQTEVSR